MDNVENYSISELLSLSKHPRHLLHAYREIRQEVSFLATLNNPFLTELCGVRTTPYMCLLLELAPKKSLRSMLKEYKECGCTLEPLTLKNTALQVNTMYPIITILTTFTQPDAYGNQNLKSPIAKLLIQVNM